MTAAESGARGVPFPIGSVAALTFTVLKLTGHIDWSWVWVLAPAWIPLAAIAAIMFVVVAYHVIKSVIS